MAFSFLSYEEIVCDPFLTMNSSSLVSLVAAIAVASLLGIFSSTPPPPLFVPILIFPPLNSRLLEFISNIYDITRLLTPREIESQQGSFPRPFLLGHPVHPHFIAPVMSFHLIGLSFGQANPIVNCSTFTPPTPKDVNSLNPAVLPTYTPTHPPLCFSSSSTTSSI